MHCFYIYIFFFVRQPDSVSIGNANLGICLPFFTRSNNPAIPAKTGIRKSSLPKHLPRFIEKIRIKDITFYATWTFIQVDTTVRHIAKIKSKESWPRGPGFPIQNEPHKGLYIIGVESRGIIESSLI